MEKYYSNKEPWLLLHIIHRLEDFKPGRTDIVDPERFIQAAALKMPAGTTFKPHKHIIKKPPHNLSGYRAQESWVVIKGVVRCIFYDVDDSILASPVLRPGDCSITLIGGHNYLVLEDDSIVYEYKTGPYEGQEKDKVFI